MDDAQTSPVPETFNFQDSSVLKSVTWYPASKTATVTFYNGREYDVGSDETPVERSAVMELVRAPSSGSHFRRVWQATYPITPA